MEDMEQLTNLTNILQQEARNIFDDSGSAVIVAFRDDGHAVGVTWKEKSMTLTPHPRRRDVVRYDLSNGRYGFEPLHSIPGAAVNLLHYLSRS